MTKAELIDVVAEKAGISKKAADEAVKATFAAIKGAEKFVLIGFGSFAYKVRAARLGRNPQTGAELKIAEKRVLTFKPSKAE